MRQPWAAGTVSTEQAVLIGTAIDKVSTDVPGQRIDTLQGELVG